MVSWLNKIKEIGWQKLSAIAVGSLIVVVGLMSVVHSIVSPARLAITPTPSFFPTPNPTPIPSPIPTPTPTSQASPKTTPKAVAKVAQPSPSPEESKPTPSPVAVPSPSPSPTPKAGCQSNANPTFTHHITDTSKISSVVVPPRFISGDLKTHSYINTNHQRVPVYAPADLTLKRGVYLQHANGDLDYGLDSEVTCEIMIRFGHITDPVQSIKDAFGPTPRNDSITQNITPITFSAGDLLAYTTGTTAAGNWDFGAYNSTTKNRYAENPTYSKSTIWSTAVCPYDFFTSGLKSVYTAKYIQEFGNSTTDGPFFCQ